MLVFLLGCVTVNGVQWGAGGKSKEALHVKTVWLLKKSAHYLILITEDSNTMEHLKKKVLTKVV